MGTITYSYKSTSSSSAEIEDIEFSRTSTTRRIIRPMIVENNERPDASIKIEIIHQKAEKGLFEDIPTEKLSKYKAKDIGKLVLSSEETLSLFNHLCNLYLIHKENGIPSGYHEFEVDENSRLMSIDSKRAAIIETLIQQGYSEEVWEKLVENSPDLATKLSIARLYQTRMTALEQFRTMLSCDHSEQDWQSFFENNNWIFGYGLNYKILKAITGQPHYGGVVIDGSRTNKGDFLSATQGYLKFTVLVEIKRSDTKLLASKRYRNDVVLPSEDLIGGVSQLRVNGRTWEQQGSQLPKNRDLLEDDSIYTIQPRKILVIGNTNELNDRLKRENFELFRRGQSDIEILTFDELLNRAQFITEHTEAIKDG
ncbi:TPA: DUF4263 domain-containing protein [Legionella pneumophila]|nr:DUF4263 domain-containing protein [Legionella pneumophila]